MTWLFHKLGFDKGRDAVDGMPRCAHCGMVFRKMQALKQHITKRTCQKFSETKLATKSIDGIPRVQELLRSN